MFLYNAIVALPLVALVHAGPLFGRNPHVCDTGSIQCCQSVQSAGSPVANAAGILLGAFGSVLDDGQIGLQCTSLAGAGSAGKCSSNPVCCNNTQFNGLINVGCSSIPLDL